MSAKAFHLKKIIPIIAFLILNAPLTAIAQDEYEFQNILTQTLESNPSLMAAREELAATKERYNQAKAGWLPSLTVETSIFATDIDNSNFGGADGTTTKDLTVSATQPIWQGGRTFAETDRAKNLIKAGEAILRNAEQNMTLQSLSAYSNLLRDQKLSRYRKRNEEILQEEYNATKNRFDLGDVTKTDVELVKTRMLRAQADTHSTMSSYDISISEFEEITNTAPPQTLTPLTDYFNFPETLEEMIAIAEDQNPEMHIMRFEQEAAKNNLKATISELFPQIAAFASYNKQIDPQPGILDDSSTKTIGVRATLALYQGGATRSRIREARHAVKRYDYDLESTKRSIKQNVTSNWRLYRAAKKQSELRQGEINSAQNVLKGLREEAKAGQRALVDILDADEDLIQAQISMVEAQHNETIAKYNLAKELGMLN